MEKFLANKNLLRNALVTIYVLIVLGFSATAKAQMSILPIFENKGQQQVKIENYVGQVAMTLEGQFFLVVSDDQVYELKSNVDLTDYNGLTVTVAGYEVKHKVKPVVELASLDPLPRNNETTVAPLLIVFGISEISK